ncbi:MAG: 4Fe-4S binding protein, partial [Thermoleophilia bacterium]
MDAAERLDKNHELPLKEFPYIIEWRDDRCTRCGRCTAVCPVNAIEPTVRVQRKVTSEGLVPTPTATRRLDHVVSQVDDIERYCTGCATCQLVCPAEAIRPEYNGNHKFLFFKNQGGGAYRRGGRRNDPSPS